MNPNIRTQLMECQDLEEMFDVIRMFYETEMLLTQTSSTAMATIINLALQGYLKAEPNNG